MSRKKKARCTYKGSWYGIGSCWVAPHMYYNADRLKAAGIEPPSNDPAKAWDWDTFVTNAKLLTIDKNGKNATEKRVRCQQHRQVWCELAELVAAVALGHPFQWW